MTESVLSQLNTRDPYESKVVEVRQSLIPGAGQGLFMRRGVEGGVVVAYFAGVVVEGARCADSQYSISWLAGAGPAVSSRVGTRWWGMENCCFR